MTDSEIKWFTTGQLSKQTGCNIETIRYYERIGVLPAPPRSAGGRRQFTTTHMKRLMFIRRGRMLGFRLLAQQCEKAIVPGATHFEGYGNNPSIPFQTDDPLSHLSVTDAHCEYYPTRLVIRIGVQKQNNPTLTLRGNLI